MNKAASFSIFGAALVSGILLSVLAAKMFSSHLIAAVFLTAVSVLVGYLTGRLQSELE